MQQSLCRVLVIQLCLPLAGAASAQAAALTYADIAPILQARCAICHAGPPYLDNEGIARIADWINQGACLCTAS
ncbi:MAG: hypothetical protein ACRERX_01080 [Pseudomonas sp.]